MTSNDNVQYVTVEAFNAATEKTNQHLASIDKKLAEIDISLTKLDRTMTEIRYEMGYFKYDTDHLQTSIYWGFAIIAIVIAIVGLVIARAPTNKQEKQDTSLTRSEIQEIVRSEMQITVDEAVARALSAKK